MKKYSLIQASLVLALLFTSVSNLRSQTIDLFNSLDLNNWEFISTESSRKSKDLASVQNGVITIKGEPNGYIRTKDKYSDYVLYVEWRWPSVATNSGIFVHTQSDDKVWPTAFECQLKSENAGDIVLLGEANVAEFVVREGEQRPEFPVVKKGYMSSELPVGEWNSAFIVCDGGTITIFINGVQQNKVKKASKKKGYIALQSEGKEVQFRNVRLTPWK